MQNRDDAAATVTIPVLGYTQEPPVLREEYDNYALVQFLSASLWEQIEEVIWKCRTRHIYPRTSHARANLNGIEYDRNGTDKYSRA